MAETILASKRAFLESQVRILSAALEVPEPEHWQAPRRRRDSDNEPADLSLSVVEDVLKQVNDRLRRHNAAAFPPAALAHVAAQLDALREHATTHAPEAASTTPAGTLRAVAEPGVRADGTIERGAVLTADATIAALPDVWPADDAVAPPKRRSRGSRPSTLEAFAGEQDYAGRRRRLLELQEERVQAQQRLAQLRQLKGLLAPLEDPETNVQPNLVGRDGEVGRELERMRVLLERAAGKVRGWE